MSFSKDYGKYPTELRTLLEQFDTQQDKDIVLEFETEKAAMAMRAKCYAYFRALDKAAQPFRNIAIKNPKADIPNIDLDFTMYLSAVSKRLMLLVEGNKLIWRTRAKDPLAVLIRKQLGIAERGEYTTGSRSLDAHIERKRYDLECNLQGVLSESFDQKQLDMNFFLKRRYAEEEGRKEFEPKVETVINEEEATAKFMRDMQAQLQAEKPSLEEGLAMYKKAIEPLKEPEDIPRLPKEEFVYREDPEQLAKVAEIHKNMVPSFTMKGDGHASTRPEEFIQLENGKWVMRSTRAGKEEEKRQKRLAKLKKGTNDGSET